MKLIDQSAAYIRTRLAGHAMPHTAIILGSGLGLLADRIENPVVIPYADIPNFPKTSPSSIQRTWRQKCQTPRQRNGKMQSRESMAQSF